MELLVASAIGVLTAAGIYLILRLRTFPVIIGTSLISYAVNVFLFASGRLALNAPPILRDGVEVYTDPLPQALVLTAIVISFGMTAVVVMIAVGSYLSAGDDLVNEPDTLAGADTAEPSPRGGGPA
ncbi:MAG: Na+/H+ antiporter subunit C [Roseobacter sp.]|jgi:multicomponent K+:H+ antiporter subunit C|uniref:Multisubunit potassium/proton antiporter, PhaC subunit n=3 Tax=Sulfitobacter TaxID=60136 RepID=A0A1H2U0I9_9RHOB|nr:MULTISPECIES: Na+/H+ antiporter subunit C [Sulfitobacter]MAN09063.1 Na+/H+ antiporter subunit C [Roseobacter sp.]NKX47007.1 Na+/H+ antiporter subunit C [Rhodobacteraceae bacterium R_SAG8]EAP84205.1 pH adaption potassium efflux system, PhaC subunit [Sulfitobacter sp. EE-36]KAJ29776.1 cation:proton antiporter [Sulfitobacter pontiacus 3SOLIMAR09]MAX76289.1 Na+/H+ antiporter subunit C [Roseobacter sp.]|tara:strand:- start:213 stop:590 length:378 start_codon:yes stop_codon:yes gene_type:complete